MPVPDFSPGEVLTAAAMDSIGLWLVKTQTIGTAVSSVTVTDAFSADYDNYLVTVTEVDCSTAAPSFRLTFGGVAGSAYYGSMYFDKSNGLDTGLGRANAGAFLLCGIGGDSNEGYLNMTVMNPSAAKRTAFTSQYYGGTYSGWASGMLYTNDPYTLFALTISSGNMTGGTIRVYGYRN
jgi:hypothetical protein